MKTKIVAISYPVRDIVIEQLIVTVPDDMTDEKLKEYIESHGHDFDGDLVEIEDREIIDREYSGDAIPMPDGSPCVCVNDIEEVDDDDME